MSKHQSQNGIALMMVLSLVSHSLRTRQEMNIGSPNVTQSWEFKQIRANTSYYMGDNILLCRNIVYDGLRQMANNYIYIYNYQGFIPIYGNLFLRNMTLNHGGCHLGVGARDAAGWSDVVAHGAPVDSAPRRV